MDQTCNGTAGDQFGKQEEIVEVMPLAQSTVSEHLKILKQAGLVQGEVDGPRVCYCVHPGILGRFKALVEAL